MVTGKDIVEAAREYLGTPWRHQGRVKGKGIDCAGLLSCVCKDLELPWHPEGEPLGYARAPSGDSLIKAILACGARDVPIEKRQIGDILVMWWNRHTHIAQHTGILTDVGIIHAYTRGRPCGSRREGGQVVETVLNSAWNARICCVLRFPGVE